MFLGITWYTLEEASAKYSLDRSLILRWVEEGVIRAEPADKGGVQVNIDDLDLIVHEMALWHRCQG